MSEYTLEIERGHSKICDFCIDFIKPHIHGSFLDVGCNAGWLLSEMPDGVGLDASKHLVNRCHEKGLNAIHGYAYELPFNDNNFDTVVIINTLEQIMAWEVALLEAIRVAKERVIGINPMPGKSQWGYVGGHVESVIPPSEIELLVSSVHQVNIFELEHGKYYFEILKNANKHAKTCTHCGRKFTTTDAEVDCFCSAGCEWGY